MDQMRDHWFMEECKLNPSDKNAELIQKDKHHISWKNHGIDQLIKSALENYLQRKEMSK